MSKLSAIPSAGQDVQSLQRSARALAQNMEQITGTRGSKIQKLSAGATTADIISKLNELIDRLQGD